MRLRGGATLIGSYALWRADRELKHNGQASSPTAVIAYVAYATHAAVVGIAAGRSIWTLPLQRGPARLAGLVMGPVGASLYGAGTVKLGSADRISGTRVDKLVTRGIFRYTRNPQYLGWGLLLLGMSVASRSAHALLSTALYGAAVHFLVVQVEERRLGDAFGEPYRRYQAAVARWL